MVRKPRDKQFSRVLSIDELVEVCKVMEKMSLKDSIEFGKSKGITRHNVESIRQMLGYSDSSYKFKLTSKERDALATEYQEGDISMAALARKHGVTYNAVRCILVSRDVSIRNPKGYTKRQEMYIKNELKRGTPIKKIASAMGKTYKCIKGKIDRMNARSAA